MAIEQNNSIELLAASKRFSNDAYFSYLTQNKLTCNGEQSLQSVNAMKLQLTDEYIVHYSSTVRITSNQKESDKWFHTLFLFISICHNILVTLL